MDHFLEPHQWAFGDTTTASTLDITTNMPSGAECEHLFSLDDPGSHERVYNAPTILRAPKPFCITKATRTLVRALQPHGAGESGLVDEVAAPRRSTRAAG